MLKRENTGFIKEILLSWYLINKRDLPWRKTQNPYKIWVSEIILQQTRVNQGLDYYIRFIDRFPDVAALATAEEDEVLKYWQGLGYYSRARNLHAAAKSIMTQFEGNFPEDYSSVLSLKGIGEYTAAAIVSFAWNKPYPVVDGNVFRFLSRLLAIEEPIDTSKGKQLFFDIAGDLMDTKQPGLFNQAIMEFGALQCLPASPDCPGCPFNDKCLAHINGKVAHHPVKKSKTVQQDRYLQYFHIVLDECTFLYKRTGKDIWQNLYEFPLIESLEYLSFEELQKEPAFQQLFASENVVQCTPVFLKKKHVLSHRILYASFYKIILTNESESLASFLKIRSESIDAYPTHRLMEYYLEHL